MIPLRLTPSFLAAQVRDAAAATVVAVPAAAVARETS